MSQRTYTNNHDLVSYFVLAFAISWLLWLPALLASNDLATLPVWLTAMRHLAIFGPTMAAFGLIYRAEGWDGMKRLWQRGWNFSFDKRWLVPVLGLPLLMMGLTIIGINLAGGSIGWQHGIPPLMIVPVFLIIYLLNALPEEYGWRGFALGRLQAHHSALMASLILGALHGLWHLPLHFIDGTTQQVIPVWQFILKVTIGAIIYTWLYNHTDGNIFLVSLYHAFSNTLGGAIPFWVTNQGRWINFGVELVVVVVIVLVYGAQRLMRDKGEIEPGQIESGQIEAGQMRA